MQAQGHIPVTAIPAALKLVKDAVIFIQGAQFTAEVFMDLEQKTTLNVNIHASIASSLPWTRLSGTAGVLFPSANGRPLTELPSAASAERSHRDTALTNMTDAVTDVRADRPKNTIRIRPRQSLAQSIITLFEDMTTLCRKRIMCLSQA